MTASNPELVIPLIIGGKEDNGSSTFDVVSATTGKVCWKAASASSEDAIRAVEAAKKAFPSWSKVKPREKQKILFKTADILESRSTEYGNIMQMEMGGAASPVHGFILPTGEGHSAMIWKEPYGVILGIGPFNAPFALGMRAAATAIATGNTTVLKGSELTPKCYWALGKVFHDAGLPAGVLNIIYVKSADGAAVTNTIIRHPAVRKINFTGSTDVGSKIAQSRHRMYHRGAREFWSDISRLQEVVAKALSEGASSLLGDTEQLKPKETDGTSPVVFTPMIIGDIKEDMPLWRDENFGPVVAYMIAKSDEEAIDMANDTEYGLSAAVFTQDLRKGFTIAKQLESGAVHINSMSVRDEPALPMGGVKKSGWGRFNTVLGMEEFLVAKSVTWDD
ncbi:hypothetical protein EYC84_010410 [Monilinia fructicola]|uniref:Aldehyde dehydrogenase domain-containing protein n=1 Tax=Monilinia fructicola TaxID=38448 RepID=A0A5M9JFH4_MONFR|nr:hypothetical protein EYC84_010410 [Monilinia fructicola]